jgi:GT2 family glycosyltransferase
VITKNVVQVQCVYGDGHIEHIRRVLIPALADTTSCHVRFVCTNYAGKGHERIKSGQVDNIEIVDIENTSSTPTGFAENHNRLFDVTQPSDFFVLLNPDCIPHKGAIDLLIRRREMVGDAAIVEGRQWPFEHPKEYDALSLETPWASGAFSLIDSEFYRSIGGMDPLYFLYLEDVDISWQAWLNGYRVIYEPASVVTHFSGGRFYREDLVSNEQFLSLRNFLVIAKKFFGDEGEAGALAYLRSFGDRELAALAEKEYVQGFRENVDQRYVGHQHPNVKILGLNCFHRMR